jgi:ribosomal protein L21
MNAVVKTGGKEYRISRGDLIRVEKMEGKVGDQVTMKDILMTYDLVGDPGYKDFITATSHLTGKTINRFTHIHQTVDDLLKKQMMTRVLSRLLRHLHPAVHGRGHDERHPGGHQPQHAVSQDQVLGHRPARRTRAASSQPSVGTYR